MPKSKRSLTRRIKLETRRKKLLRSQVYTFTKKGKLILDIMTGDHKSNSLSPAMAREMLFISKNRINPIYLKNFDLKKYYNPYL